MKMSASELDQIRQDIEDATMPDTCTILGLTQTPDGAGDFSQTWGTVTAAVPCRLDPVRSTQRGEMLTAASIASYQAYILTVPYDTTLTTANRILHDGITYNVTRINGGSWLTAKRAIVEQI